MRIAITGALGHIGSRFIHSIAPGDYELVLLLENLSTHRYCSLFSLPEGVPYRFVEEDICTADLKHCFTGVDAVIHLAAITDASASFETREEVERVNYEGTKKVAQACKSCGCNLIFPSTTSVYGTQNAIVDEDCSEDELKPQSPYANSKLRSEKMLLSLGERKELSFIICRLGTIVGPSIGMRFHTAVNRFVWQACRGQPITVWRTALDQERPYVDLGDAVRALRFVLKNRRFDNEIYNVLTTNATVREIVDMIRIHFPKLEIEYTDSPVMNQLSYTVACEKFKATGFRFTGSLKQGIDATVTLIQGLYPG